MAALQDVSFSMERGETVAILGQNGSGKSTLVRLLSTLLLHDGGEARVFGHDVFTEPRAVRRLVNRVSVEASFFKKMSAAENLSYAARFYGMTAASTRDRIPAILERVGFPCRRHETGVEQDTVVVLGRRLHHTEGDLGEVGVVQVRQHQPEVAGAAAHEAAGDRSPREMIRLRQRRQNSAYSASRRTRP